MSAPPQQRLPLVGICAGVALLGLLIGKPALTTIWLTALVAGVVCGFLLSRFPLRRLTPTDLRSASIWDDESSGASGAMVDPAFAPQYIRPLPELVVIAGVSFVFASFFGNRVSEIFGTEVKGCVAPCIVLATLCAVLAGREMLRWRTNEFILRARQGSPWRAMLMGRGVTVGCHALGCLPFTTIPGLTQPNTERWYVPNHDVARKRLIDRSYSPSGNVVLEIRDAERGMRALWVRAREPMSSRSLVEIYTDRITAKISPDDRWLAVTREPDRGQTGVDFLERSGAAGAGHLRYANPQGPQLRNLSSRVTSFYTDKTGDSFRFLNGKANVNAFEWTGDKLKLTLRFSDLPPDEQVEPWVCTYSPEADKLEAVSPLKITDNVARWKVQKGECEKTGARTDPTSGEPETG